MLDPLQDLLFLQVSGETKNVYSGLQAFHVITITPGSEVKCSSPSEPNLCSFQPTKLSPGGACVSVCHLPKPLQNTGRDGNNGPPEQLLKKV